MASVRFLPIVVLTSALSAMAVHGWGAAPAWEKDLTRAPLGPHRTVPVFDLTYEIGWNRLVSAGQVKLALQDAGRFWRAEATGGTTGLARKLWRYDMKMLSLVTKTGLRSSYAEHEETDSKETCRYRVSFAPARVVTETRVAPHDGAATVGSTIFPYGPVEDLLANILYVRSQDLTAGKTITRVIQPWDRPYVTTYRVLGRDQVSSGGKKVPCIKLAVEVRKIDRSTMDIATYGKVKKATVWLSDDEWRLPLEMRAEIFVGYISARVTEIRKR